MLGGWAAERIRGSIERALADLGVRFDVWTGETSIHAAGWVERGIAALREGGHIYEQDGATWFRSTAFGDDRDRVVIRSNGLPTYFASDIGYVAEKFSRGFEDLIYVWGEDHHGTVARVRNAAAALGFDRDAVQMILIAWVRFIRDGQEIGLSKRSGEFITLDELLREIGPDAARWFFGSRATSTGIDFDLDLATRQANENPVYYVQYAHARCASILRHAAERSSAPDGTDGAALLRHPAEQALIRRHARAARSADRGRRAARDARAAALLPRGGEPVQPVLPGLSRPVRRRAADPRPPRVVDATRQVLANALGLMGISAPDSM